MTPLAIALVLVAALAGFVASAFVFLPFVAWAERRLRAYMFEHAQNAALSGPQGMIPFVRVVSHEEP